MIRIALIVAFVLGLPLGVAAQTSQPAPDVKSFEITPAPPPVPALKYELLYDLLTDRIPGNAAMLYIQTCLLMGAESPKVALDALDAYEANDLEKFNQLAEKIDRPPIFKNLDVAARRDTCDWDPPIRQLGAYTWLPHLEPIAHGLTNMIKVRALQQMENGKPDEAIATLRLGYEMSDKVGREPTLVSGLVALRIGAQMNDVLIRLMSRPNAPNLYWALLQMPSGRGLYRNSLHVERRFLVPAVPRLEDAIKGDQLTPQEWRTILDYMAELQAIDPGEGAKKKVVDPVKAATPENLKQARELYAKQHNLKPDQVEKLDPVVVLGNFYVRQADIVSDDIFKLRNLPYPELFKQSRAVQQRQEKLKKETPATPFLPMLDLGKTTERLAQSDRQHAAMVNVEAIRSYAAANNGKLPPQLGDITDTPAMENPWTGQPFEYAVKDDVATLADSKSPVPLTYTIRIRK
jgi:hypothetical protein